VSTAPIPGSGDRPDLSIVMTSLDSSDWLRRSLPNVRETLGSVRAELIVVDNGSRDDSLEAARQAWPGAVTLPQRSNLGWVSACNIGMAAARGRYVMLLNSDIEVQPGYFDTLLAFMEAHPDAGVCSGRILNPDGSDQGTARNFPSVANGLFGRRSWLSRRFPGNPWSRRFLVGRHREGDAPFRVEILSGCCLMMPTSLVRELGGMDEAFDIYWGDADLCNRIRDRGLGVYCVPRAALLHHEGEGGSTRTWRLRMRMVVAFHQGAYRAYAKANRLAPLHPARWLAAAALGARAGLLLVLQTVRPGRSSTSGGRN
jgi:N-acetylglucosaminyl-diphospho-decaprenol L-rhamnosyltransferase